MNNRAVGCLGDCINSIAEAQWLSAQLPVLVVMIASCVSTEELHGCPDDGLRTNSHDLGRHFAKEPKLG